MTAFEASETYKIPITTISTWVGNRKNGEAVYESGGRPPLVDPNVMKGLVSTILGPISERTSDFEKKLYEAQKQTAEIRNQWLLSLLCQKQHLCDTKENK